MSFARQKPDGTFDVGGRRINDVEAAVVLRIFESYASGMPPRKIAWMLNDEGVPGPRGKGWGASTIIGNAERGVGILNNPALRRQARLEQAQVHEGSRDRQTPLPSQ